MYSAVQACSLLCAFEVSRRVCLQNMGRIQHVEFRIVGLQQMQLEPHRNGYGWDQRGKGVVWCFASSYYLLLFFLAGSEVSRLAWWRSLLVYCFVVRSSNFKQMPGASVVTVKTETTGTRHLRLALSLRMKLLNIAVSSESTLWSVSVGQVGFRKIN